MASKGISEMTDGKMCNDRVMPVEQLISLVAEICRKNGVKHLSLFGSFATGTAAPRSDVDFIVYGCEDKETLLYEIDQIETLRKVDLFFYDEISNEFLLEDIERYGKQIY